MCANLLTQTYNAVDTLLIGRILGDTAYCAVGVAGSIMNLLLFLISGFCLGVCVLFAAAHGAKNHEKLQLLIANTLLLGGAFSLLLPLVLYLSLPYLLTLMQTPDLLRSAILSYLRVILLGTEITFFYQLVLSLFTALGQTKLYLGFLSLSVVLNILLDGLFLTYLLPSIAGAALATVLSQLVAAILAFVVLRRRYGTILPTRLCYDKDISKTILRFGLASALQQSSLYIGKLLVQTCVNAMGTEAIAAYTATNRIEGYLNAFGTGMCQSISVFLSQNLGAGKEKRAKEGFIKGQALLLGLTLIFGPLLYFCAPYSMSLFLAEGSANLGEVSSAVLQGTQYLQLIAFFYLFAFLGNGFQGYFRGYGHASIPAMGTTLQIVIRVVLSFWLAQKMGLNAVALATGIGWVCIVIFQYSLYRLQNHRGVRPA